MRKREEEDERRCFDGREEQEEDFVFNRVEMVNVEYMIINILRTRHISNNHRVNS